VRKDQWNVTVNVDGRKLGTFDVKTGGDTDTNELTYLPGAMMPAISLGGMVTVAAVVVHRLYSLERDQAIVHWLLERVGFAKCVVNQQPLDPDKNAWGKPLVVKGTLKRVTVPEVDSNTTEASLLELEITPQGGIT
jgi:hypothetical protein